MTEYEIDSKTGERRAKQSLLTQSTVETIDAQTLSTLESLSKPELMALIRRVGGAIWGIGLMTLEERIEAAKLKLWDAGLNEKELLKALPVLKEVMDREIGKPKNQIELTGKDGGPLSVRLIEAQQRLLKGITIIEAIPLLEKNVQ